MTDPDAVWLFLYSDGTQQDKNSERTEIRVGLNDWTGLENIFTRPSLDVLYSCSKERSYFAEVLQKDSWCNRLLEAQLFQLLLHQAPPEEWQTHDEDIGGSRGAFHCECICC